MGTAAASFRIADAGALPASDFWHRTDSRARLRSENLNRL